MGQKYRYYKPEEEEEKWGKTKTMGKFLLGLTGGGTVGSSISDILEEKRAVKQAEEERERERKEKIAFEGYEKIPTGKHKTISKVAEDIGMPSIPEPDYGKDYKDVIRYGEDVYGKRLTEHEKAKQVYEKEKWKKETKPELDIVDTLKKIKEIQKSGGKIPKITLRGEDYSIAVGGEVPYEEKVKREEEKETRKLRNKARRDLDTYSSDAMQSLVAIDKIEQAGKDLGDFETGIASQLLAKGDVALKKFGEDPKVAGYLGIIAQELIPAARKIMEEKGPITEFDVARVEQGLGNVTAPLETKLKLLDELRNKIKMAIKNKMSIAEVSTEEFSERYPGLYKSAFRDDIESDEKELQAIEAEEHQEAIDWANQNPDDPRAIEILRLHGR